MSADHTRPTGVLTASLGGTKAAWAGAVWLGSIFLAVLFAPLSPHEVDLVSLPDSFLPPSSHHLLGTDEVGRDILTRLLYGGRLSLLVGVTSALVAAAVAIGVGVLGAAGNRWLRRLAHRLNEGFNIFPALFALIVGYGMFGDRYHAGGGTVGALVLGVLIGVFSWPTITPAVVVRIADFQGSPRMTSLLAIGAGRGHVFARHLLPVVAATIWPLLPSVVGGSLIAEGTLSFLGFGFQPPVASWGTMMASGEAYVLQTPMLIVAPGLCLAATVASLLAVGEATRKALS